jgi:hypothetical protein
VPRKDKGRLEGEKSMMSRNRSPTTINNLNIAMLKQAPQTACGSMRQRGDQQSAYPKNSPKGEAKFIFWEIYFLKGVIDTPK